MASAGEHSQIRLFPCQLFHLWPWKEPVCFHQVNREKKRKIPLALRVSGQGFKSQQVCPRRILLVALCSERFNAEEMSTSGKVLSWESR